MPDSGALGSSHFNSRTAPLSSGSGSAEVSLFACVFPILPQMIRTPCIAR